MVAAAEEEKFSRSSAGEEIYFSFLNKSNHYLLVRKKERAL